MDLVDYDQSTFDNIVKEYTEFLNQIEMEPNCFIPVNSRGGDNHCFNFRADALVQRFDRSRDVGQF